MDIQKVSIMGLGALGTLYGHHLSKRMPQGALKIVADAKRIERYQRDRVFCNGESCVFSYVTPEEDDGPADLLIIAVKYNALSEAVEAVRNQVGAHTIIISLLNGIISEQVIAKAYGMDKVIHCVAQGMDAVKVENQLTYHHMGLLCFGDEEPGVISEKVRTLADFFVRMDVPHGVETHMIKKLWGKLMVNVGVNQTVALYGENYASIQKPGRAREIMIAAMKEVIALSEKEGVHLNQDDLHYWLGVLDTLSPEGKPSMRQDVEARRYSEVELFAGTIRQLGEKHRVPTPINDRLYDDIKMIESRY